MTTDWDSTIPEKTETPHEINPPAEKKIGGSTESRSRGYQILSQKSEKTLALREMRVKSKVSVREIK